MEQILDKIYEFATTAGLKIVISIIILIVGWILVNALVKSFSKSKFTQKLERGVQTFLKSFLGIALKALLILTVANYLGVPMTSIVTLLGTIGLAIGMSLQGGLSNIAGGIMILLFKPFEIGDFITSGGLSGTVRNIDIFYTTVVTPDNHNITLPNGTLSNAVVENFSKNDTRRVDMKFSVSYSAEVEPVRMVIKDVLDSDQRILKDPAPDVFMSAHGDSAVVWTVRPWCKRADYWAVYASVTEEIKKAFDKNGISIPFPQLDVHIDKTV